MLKNSVLRKQVNTKDWLVNAAIRALKTFCQSLVALITVGNAITSFNWLEMVSVAATSAVVSILMSVAGIPEVEADESEEE